MPAEHATTWMQAREKSVKETGCRKHDTACEHDTPFLE